MTEHQYDLFADYKQFYLQDEEADGDLSDSWTPEATELLLALAPGTIGVGTARNTTIPVIVQVLDTHPSDDLAEWDQVNECSIAVLSGRIVIAGCTDCFPDAARIAVPPGGYRARIYYGGLETPNEDRLEGHEHYKVVLWPAPEAETKVLKQRAVILSQPGGLPV